MCCALGAVFSSQLVPATLKSEAAKSPNDFQAVLPMPMPALADSPPTFPKYLQGCLHCTLFPPAFKQKTTRRSIYLKNGGTSPFLDSRFCAGSCEALLAN